MVVFLHGNVYIGTIANRNILVNKPHIGKRKDGITAFNVDGIAAVHVGYGTICRALLSYGYTNHRLAVGVCNLTGYRLLLRLGNQVCAGDRIIRAGIGRNRARRN